MARLGEACGRSPVTALLGPRQCGKTTLARQFGDSRNAVYFDCESQADLRRLENPELVLGPMTGLIIIDEIQAMPNLFKALRVLVDRPEAGSRFLVLGSASPQVVRSASETLAGRVEFVELSGFDLSEVGEERLDELWLRGGFPRAFLAASNADSIAWHEGFIRTFLERDIPQLGITIPSTAMRRFWTMVAHYHGQVWNASELARSMGLSGKTVRSYLDILSGTFMVRQVQPWYENIGKRQVKAPKVYLRDTGLLHSLLGINGRQGLLGHPRIGASWEGFAIEQTLKSLKPSEAFFWATYSGAEVDLFLLHGGKRYAFEMKFNEAPKITRSMRVAIDCLGLDHLFVVYPGIHAYPADNRISVVPLRMIGTHFKSDPREITAFLGEEGGRP